jgi:hypothetical protein
MALLIEKVLIGFYRAGYKQAAQWAESKSQADAGLAEFIHAK